MKNASVPDQAAEYVVTVGSLFSGIGGLDLGLERAGMRIIWQAETDPYASRVLARHWPDVPNLGDVTTIDWSGIERPDGICGGYPCQPFSHAGRRGGTDDARHLWPYFADALRLLRPRWALLENVPGHLSLGFADVLADLAGLGFDAEWQLLPASAFGAPHLRYRLFVVAHAHGAGPQGLWPERELAEDQGEIQTARSDWWATEPGVGRVAYGIPHRVDRLRGLGNAVVPQVAEYVGRLLVQHIDGSEGG